MANLHNLNLNHDQNWLWCKNYLIFSSFDIFDMINSRGGLYIDANYWPYWQFVSSLSPRQFGSSGLAQCTGLVTAPHSSSQAVRSTRTLAADIIWHIMRKINIKSINHFSIAMGETLQTISMPRAPSARTQSRDSSGNSVNIEIKWCKAVNKSMISFCSWSHGRDEQQGDRAQGPQAPEHPAGPQRQDPQPSPLRHRAQDRRLRVRPVPAGRGDGGHAVRLPDVHGARGDHVAAVRRQGRPLVPRHDRVPVPHRQGPFPGKLNVSLI